MNSVLNLKSHFNRIYFSTFWIGSWTYSYLEKRWKTLTTIQIHSYQLVFFLFVICQTMKSWPNLLKHYILCSWIKKQWLSYLIRWRKWILQLMFHWYCYMVVPIQADKSIFEYRSVGILTLGLLFRMSIFSSFIN